MKKIRRIILAREVVQLLQQAVIDAGDKAEICGLLSGEIEDSELMVRSVLPLRNLSPRRESFAIDPVTIYQERKRLRKDGQKLLAIYHSHPVGSVHPSFRDLELLKLTNLHMLIMARKMNKLLTACYGCNNKRTYTVEVVSQN